MSQQPQPYTVERREYTTSIGKRKPYYLVMKDGQHVASFQYKRNADRRANWYNRRARTR